MIRNMKRVILVTCKTPVVEAVSEPTEIEQNLLMRFHISGGRELHADLQSEGDHVSYTEPTVQEHRTRCAYQTLHGTLHTRFHQCVPGTVKNVTLLDSCCQKTS